MSWRDHEPKKPHGNLVVWQLGMKLARRIYVVTSQFPDSEKYELVSQLRRAAVSVPASIAEGASRSTAADFRRFLYQARGSLSEIDTQMRLAADFGYLSPDSGDRAHETFQHLSRALQGLIDKLEQD